MSINYVDPSTGSLTPIAGTPAKVINSISNPNLLDNWYFIGGGSQQGSGHFPINQRGLTQYSATRYSIDRWKCTNANANSIITINSDSIDFQNGTNGTSFEHFFENIDHIKGHTVTLSALIKHVSGSGFSGVQIGYTTEPGGTISWTEMSGTAITSQSSEYTIVYVSTNIPDDAVDFYPRFRNNVALDVGSIKAIKLEYGDHQTLAKKKNDKWVLNDVAPNYQQELAKCQRYFIRLKTFSSSDLFAYIGHAMIKDSTHGRIFAPLPVVLRAKPTVTANIPNAGDIKLVAASGDDSTNVTSIAFDCWGVNGIGLNVITPIQSVIAQGSACEAWIHGSGSAYIDLSADL